MFRTFLPLLWACCASAASLADHAAATPPPAHAAQAAKAHLESALDWRSYYLHHSPSRLPRTLEAWHDWPGAADHAADGYRGTRHR